MTDAVTVTELWRYPVKSMGGTRVDGVAIDERGVHADRLWAVRDLELGATTTARRVPALMLCTARFASEPPPGAGPGHAVEAIVTFPDGEELSTGDAAIHARLSELVGRPVELRPLPALDDKAAYRTPRVTGADMRRQFGLEEGEAFPDLSTIPVGKLAHLSRYATPVGSFADTFPLHLLSTGSMDAMRELAPGVDFDVRRFRPNVVVDGGGEFGWCGGALVGDDIELEVVTPTVRCSMPVRPQPGLDAEPDVMRTIKNHSDRCLGTYVDVRRGGTLAVGDELRLDAGSDPGAARRATSRVTRGLVRAATRTAFRG